MPETIWSTTLLSLQFRNENHDPIDMFSGIIPGVTDQTLAARRRLFNSDDSMGLQPRSISALTSPAYFGASGNGSGPLTLRFNFGTASITAGIPSRHPPQDSFLQKFGSVADATRDVELSNGFGGLSLEKKSLYNNDSGILSLSDVGIMSSPHGSLNESLNRSRHQSISEKIDSYHNTSPVQLTTSLNEKKEKLPKLNLWSPATATTFTPYSMYEVPAPPPAPLYKKFDEEKTFYPNYFEKDKRQPKRKGKPGRANHIHRSVILEEVRAKEKDYKLKDIYGHAIEFTRDQYGSRFIQQKLSELSKEEKEMIFNEIRDISFDLMTDVFGNYVIQKFFDYGSKSHRLILLSHMLGHIYELSLQMYGCRVVQRALETTELEQQILIIEELRNDILNCAKDQNANHVIQKSIERIPFEKIEFILDSLDTQIYHLLTHPYGCRVIQRLLEFAGENGQQRILSELDKFIFYLIQDQYGNYVMQHILEHGSVKDKDAIFQVVSGSVVNFSKHKFASNVIEKCINTGTLEQRKVILSEVLSGNNDLEIEKVDFSSPIALMMKDQYANYVIQKLVEGFDSKSAERRLLVAKLRQYLKQISSKNTYGKHLASVEKMIMIAENALDTESN